MDEQQILIVLADCTLFKGIPGSEIKNILKDTAISLSLYGKGRPVALEDEECKSIGIIVDGGVEIQKIYTSGRAITIDALGRGQIFSEVIIFSAAHKYPATIVSNSDTHILFIPKLSILSLCRTNPIFLNNFMGLLSNKILMLNRKIRGLSYQTIRQKVANYLLDEYRKQKNLHITLTCSRQEMAEQLGIPRPSLSRELISLKKENIIDFWMNNVKIINLTTLEDALQ